MVRKMAHLATTRKINGSRLWKVHSLLTLKLGRDLRAPRKLIMVDLCVAARVSRKIAATLKIHDIFMAVLRALGCYRPNNVKLRRKWEVSCKIHARFTSGHASVSRARARCVFERVAAAITHKEKRRTISSRTSLLSELACKMAIDAALSLSLSRVSLFSARICLLLLSCFPRFRGTTIGVKRRLSSELSKFALNYRADERASVTDSRLIYESSSFAQKNESLK